jgi:pSer/pThr/pTyr-binding forkhead associated (FHA) protein
MKVSLVVLNSGKSAGQTIPINLAQFVIGRDPQCNLRPGSALISKRHCAVLIKGEEVFVRDFDSTNGTFLNDEPLKGEVAVKNNDVLKVGPLEFRLAIEAAPAMSASKTPTPAASSPKKATPPAPTKGASNEDAAALLLGLDDNDTSVGTKDESGVPGGSTVMDVPLNLQANESSPAKPAVEQKKKPIPVGTAQSAAQAILDKYNKRPR